MSENCCRRCGRLPTQLPPVLGICFDCICAIIQEWEARQDEPLALDVVSPDELPDAG